MLTANTEQLRGVLTLACAQAAMGGEAAIFFQLEAVALLRAPVTGRDDDAHRAAGLPDLATVLAEALELGVAVTACQSGLALAGITAEQLPEGVDIGGPVAFLAGTRDDARLLIA